MKEKMDKLTLLNIDCLEYMATQLDKAFDLAIVDPPYGIAYARGEHGWGVCDNRPKLSDVKWDKATPPNKYFKELLRISTNQIIWGGNYFADKLPVSKCWIVWNKINQVENKSVFADAELAWSSFNKVIKIFTLRQMGFIFDNSDGNRIHPTQKPVALYTWLLENYAKPGQRVLDTHLGSGSSAIAAHYFGVEFVGCEIDPDYFHAACKRVKEQTRQLRMF